MLPAPSASSNSWRTGCRALAHRRRTLPGVSSPINVVRSMQVMALSSQATCHSFLTVLFFFNDAATTEIYTLSLHDALRVVQVERGVPAHARQQQRAADRAARVRAAVGGLQVRLVRRVLDRLAAAHVVE